MNLDKLLQTCYDICHGVADERIAKENANKDADTIPVIRDLLAGTVSKELAKAMLPKDVLDAHWDGDIHYHDLDYSIASPYYNCCLVDAGDMLDKGFKMNGVQMTKPKNITSATSLLSQIIASVSSHQYGGVSVDDVDIILGEYVAATYKKHLSVAKQYLDDSKAVVFATNQTKSDTYQAIQALEYRINTLASCSGQSPFVTLGLGLGTTWQQRLVQEAILNVRLDGLGHNKTTAIFPKLVYKVDHHINHDEGDVNWDMYNLAIKCAAKRNYPDVLYLPKHRELGRSAVPMGCRSHLHEWRNEEGELVWKGRNNLGVVSLNLPRIAIESQGNIETFWSILEKRLEICKKALDTRIDRLRGVKAKVAPILYCEGALGFRLDPEDEILQVFNKGRASISLGYIGLHEVALLMFPNCDIYETPDAKGFLVKVLKVLKDATEVWKSSGKGDDWYGFGLYATPSEGLCKRFCDLDVKKFGQVPNITEKGYYMNSFHMDVGRKVSPMTKIDWEKDFVELSNSGFITFTEVPAMSQEYKEIYIKTCWQYARERVSYFGTNTIINKCFVCFSEGQINHNPETNCFVCDHCENDNPDLMDLVARVCGYMGNPTLRPWNSGKLNEYKGRVKHS